MSLSNWFRRAPAAFPAFVDLRPDFWKAEDASVWFAFRQSSAGKKLGVILNNAVTTSAVTATLDREHSQHSCGRACGVRDTIQMLDMLLPEQISPAGAQSGNYEDSLDQDQGSLEHLKP